MKKETIEKRKKEIMEKAIEIFAKKGYEKTSLDEIAKKLKISKPAIYLYFKNKEDLFLEILKNKFNEMLFELEKIISSKNSSFEKLSQFVKIYIDKHLTSDENFFKILQSANIKISGETKKMLKKKFTGCYRPLIDKLVGLIKDCIKDGYLKDGDPLFYTLALFGILDRPLFASFTAEKKFSFINADYYKTVLNLFLNGAGRKIEKGV